jgi:hypothetical protein
MRRLRHAPILGAALLATLALGDALEAQYANVALGKSVTTVGSFGVGRPGSPWGNPAPAAPSTLTDGVVPPNGTDWQTGTVWWDTGSALADRAAGLASNRVEIDLGAIFSLTGFGLSYDNNDRYTFFTKLSASDPWLARFEVFCVSCAPGMVYADFSGLSAGSPVDARYVAVAAWAGDGWYSVGEIELYSLATVPEPATLALLLTGAVAMGTVAARRRCT